MGLYKIDKLTMLNPILSEETIKEIARKTDEIVETVNDIIDHVTGHDDED